MKADPREERLPKWARDELVRLRADVARLRAAIEVGIDENTNIWAEGFVHEERPIGTDVRVIFGLRKEHPNGHKSIDGIRVWLDNGKLSVMGHRPFYIEPQAANLVHIIREDWLK